MADDTVKTDLFSAFDGTEGRPANTHYLDMQERINAEKIRAVAEGRPAKVEDLGSLPAAVGTQLVPKAYQVDNSLYANTATPLSDTTATEKLTVAESPVEAGGDVDLSLAAQQAQERIAQDQALLRSVKEKEAAAGAPSPAVQQSAPGSATPPSDPNK